MQVRRRMSRTAGEMCAMVLGLGAVLVSAGPAPVDHTPGPLLVRHAGTRPITVDTTRLTGPALRAWWVDAVGGTTVDAGSVQRGPAVPLFPPDTGDGAAHDWTLVVVDATRGLEAPA